MPEKKTKLRLDLENLAMLLSYFASKTKITSQVRIKPEIFVNFRPEPGPNPNQTQKAQPDLQLWFYGAKFISGEAINCCLFLQYEHAGP